MFNVVTWRHGCLSGCVISRVQMDLGSKPYHYKYKLGVPKCKDHFEEYQYKNSFICIN